MKIAHLAIWIKNIEVEKSFYVSFFDAKPGEKYFNPEILFPDNDVKLELMHSPKVSESGRHALTAHPDDQFTGLVRFAVGVGSKAGVDFLTERIRNGGYQVIGEPRLTGDGYYESIVLDPEGNMIEITA